VNTLREDYGKRFHFFFPTPFVRSILFFVCLRERDRDKETEIMFWSGEYN
jgi:hypothetical protein